MSLTREELLVVLIEECGEVIQAATKCLRFGYDRNHPGYGQNDLVLAKEVGDTLGVIDKLELDADTVNVNRQTKIERAELAKRLYGAPV